MPITLRRSIVPRACLAAVLAALCGAAAAQYKVVGPDGKVTYTDRAPAVPEGRVIPLGARATTAPSAQADLPFDLRQIAARYPVTLYASANACEPCESARALLRQRGIPYAERQVVTTEDSDALERLSGGRDVPTLTIGSQTLRGLASDAWNAYLEAAGYPRESRLPSSYRNPPATPIVERRDAAAMRPLPAPLPRADSSAPVTPPAAGGIRF